MDAHPPGTTRTAHLAHDVPAVSVQLSQRTDGSIVFSAVAYRFVTPSGEPYEYSLTVAPEDVDAIRVGLGAAPGQDAFEAIVAHSHEIMRAGETTWLKSLNIPYQFSCWEPWVEMTELPDTPL
jgi:hypothetical protein